MMPNHMNFHITYIGNLNNSGSIQTGDNFRIEIFIAVSILCILGLFAVNKKRKIKN